MKKQVWLRPDQVEVVLGALDVYEAELGENQLLNRATKEARRFTCRRIMEVRALFTDEIQTT